MEERSWMLLLVILLRIVSIKIIEEYDKECHRHSS